jgi:hypothetical protein
MMLRLLAPLVLVACGGAPASSAASGGGAALPAPPPHPAPLRAADKHVVWQGKDAAVYDIPSLHVLEVIAPSEKSGVDAEYRYLESLTCGPSGAGQWKSNEQSLVEEKDREYDLLHAVCSETGERHDFKFDISQYFGEGLR